MWSVPGWNTTSDTTFVCPVSVARGPSPGGPDLAPAAVSAPPWPSSCSCHSSTFWSSPPEATAGDAVDVSSANGASAVCPVSFKLGTLRTPRPRPCTEDSWCQVLSVTALRLMPDGHGNHLRRERLLIQSLARIEAAHHLCLTRLTHLLCCCSRGSLVGHIPQEHVSAVRVRDNGVILLMHYANFVALQHTTASINTGASGACQEPELC